MQIVRPAEAFPATGTAATPAVAVVDLAKSFGERSVLAGVDLSIAQGESVALIGANGTGKSTFLRCLIRLTEPDRGTIRMLDDVVTDLGAAELRRFRSKVGIVFQKHNLVPRLSALTNVVHGIQSRSAGPRTWLQALAPREVREEAYACLAAVGLEDRALQRVGSLSGGQSQKVAVARMLMQRPRLILADEPDASLDPKAGEDVMDLLLRVAREKGLTLVTVSHRLEHAVRYSDRIIGFDAGRVALDTPSAAASVHELRSFFSDRTAA